MRRTVVLLLVALGAVFAAAIVSALVPGYAALAVFGVTAVAGGLLAYWLLRDR